MHFEEVNLDNVLDQKDKDGDMDLVNVCENAAENRHENGLKLNDCVLGLPLKDTSLSIHAAYVVVNDFLVNDVVAAIWTFESADVVFSSSSYFLQVFPVEDGGRQIPFLELRVADCLSDDHDWKAQDVWRENVKRLLVFYVLYLASGREIGRESHLGTWRILYFSEFCSEIVLSLKVHQAFHGECAESLIDFFLDFSA
jgi:hypothetical protein